MKRSYWIIVGAFIAVTAVLSVITFTIRDRALKEAANQAAETLFAEGVENPYVDQAGNPITLTEYLGKIIIVNSWASWSPFSVQELQDLNEIAGEYKDKNVVVIAVNRKESKEQAERFLQTLPPLSNLKIVIDTKDHFYSGVGGYAMPESVYYDTRGTITAHRQGAVPSAEVRQIIESMLTATE